MAVNCCEVTCEKNSPKFSCSSNSSKGCSLQPCRLVKINFATDEDNTAFNKRIKAKKSKDSESPYLAGDKVQLLTRITEKRLIQKKGTGMSSFPAAVNLYKASSDEFKLMKKRNNKVKKSVLTLPTEPAPVPQACTVSDINDSEYFERNYETRVKKRHPVQNNKKSRGHKNFEFYDRDARYCSEMNIDLDCSSTDLLKPYEGGNKIAKNHSSKDRPGEAVNAHDVWAVLRNINQFQFRPSPPMSNDSIRSPKKKRPTPKKRLKRRDARIIETCQTEEFAYISRFDLDSKSPTSPSFSPSSSFDRVTVIDQKNEFSQICKQYQKKIANTCNFNKEKENMKPPATKNVKNSTQCRISPKINTKSIKMKEKSNNQLILLEPNDQAPKKATGKNCDTSEKYEGQHKKCSTSSFDMLCMEARVDCMQNTSNIRVNDSRKRIGKKNTSPKSPHEHSHNNFVYSGNSGASKEGNGDIQPCKDAQVQPIEDLTQEINPKKCKEVVLSRGLDVVTKIRTDTIQNKSRLLTSPPVIQPKLTQTEIKRRLSSLKFPIVVLGREQVSSHVPVMDGDAPQFDGLDKHIWPFMIDWKPKCKNVVNKTDSRTVNIQKKKFSSPPVESEKLRKTSRSEIVSPNKQARLQDKNQTFGMNISVKKKIEPKKPISVVVSNTADNKNKVQQGKSKSIRQLKDRVIKMLYKKPSSQNIIEEKYQDSEQGDIKTIKAPTGERRKVDAYTETSLFSSTFSKDVITTLVCSNSSNKLIHKKALAIKYPWSKGKTASDFIETVLRKIVNGVYYTHGHKQNRDSREASIQTSVTIKTNAIEPLDNISEPLVSTNTLCALPGFDNKMPDLEIKTLNVNQIAVKHCITNIMLQFDVMGPPEPSNTKINCKRSLSIIPLEIIDSQTKIFKCKTTILNAMLPAELCSLLPKMLHCIMDNDVKVGSVPPLNKTESHLSTITEITLCENLDAFPPLVFMAAEIQSLLRGMFSSTLRNPPACSVRRSKRAFNYSNWCAVMDLLPQLPRKILIDYEANIPLPIVCAKQAIEQGPVKCSGTSSPYPPHVACTDLVSYTGRTLIPQTLTKLLNLSQVVKKSFTDIDFKGTYHIPILIKPLQITCDNNSIQVDLAFMNNQGLNTVMCVTIKDMKIDSFYKWSPKNAVEDKIKAITGCDDSSGKSMTHVPNGLNVDKKYNPNKSRGKLRRGFVKLFRKCKSTTSIVCEKPTLLSKITNLDDFLQILGSSKQLFSVFDECAAKNILSCITEMKAWISEINARQALLVLLLLNKKDTPNLTRFRPILLQGIAVNRITRSHELDMEIEVIERENIKFSQYEGISYVAASRENQDNLLEELYWIAKTTASDYQKPFDETSERLLKSLLEKRKMLNPSYLRVMARYVGLGLLKSPKKNFMCK